MAHVFLCRACSNTIAADEAIGAEVRCPICTAVVVVSTDDPRPPFQVQTASSGMAIGALACAVLGMITCLPPLGIVGIILGIKAKNLARQHPRRYAGADFARAGIVVGIIGIITAASVGTYVPLAIRRSRELERRTMCMAHLRGNNTAFWMYEDFQTGVFPMINGSRIENDGAFVAFDPQMRKHGPLPGDPPSPTVDLWALIRAYDTTPHMFVCPSTTDVPDPAQKVEDYFDFQSPQNLSYSYLYQHDPDRPPLGPKDCAMMFPILADANPYTTRGVATGFADDRASGSRGNSFNHGREGQNVMYIDGYVAFETRPDIGMPIGPARTWGQPMGSGDNIYTTHKPGGTLDPGDAAPTLKGTRGTCNLGSKSDACLIP